MGSSLRYWKVDDTIDRNRKVKKGMELWRTGVMLSFKHREGAISYRYRTEAWKKGRVVDMIPGEETVKALTVDMIPK